MPDSIKANVKYFWIFIVPCLQGKKQNLETVFKYILRFKDNFKFALQ